MHVNRQKFQSGPDPDRTSDTTYNVILIPNGGVERCIARQSTMLGASDAECARDTGDVVVGLDESEHPRIRFTAHLTLLYDLAGRPPLKKLADHANSKILATDLRRAPWVSAQRLSDWRTGRTVPARFDGLAAVLRVLVAAATPLHPTPPVDGLYSAPEWHKLWDQARVSGTNPHCKADQNDLSPPYLGFSAFATEHSGLFFGRDDSIATLVELIFGNSDDAAMTVIVGASGAGKTSLLRAGLQPKLAPEYIAVEMTPGQDPFTELETALSSIGNADAAILVVDQFEELFTQTADERVQARFVERLVEISRVRRNNADDPDFFVAVKAVVLAVRADFYSHCLRFPGLAEQLEHHQMVLGSMTREEVESAIRGPAQVASIDVEPGLVSVMLRDLAADRTSHHNAGALPLLSHALRSTWQARVDNRLTVSSYEAIGGLHGLVASTAEAVWSQLDDAQQTAARQILTELVTVAEEGPYTRRKVTQSRLLSVCADFTDATTTLRALTSARIVTNDVTGVELTHEAVPESWPRLARWLSEGRSDVVLRHRIDKDALEWEAHGRDRSMLYRGIRLDTANDWVAGRHGRAETPARAFVSEAKRHERRSNMRRRSSVVVLVLLAFLAAIAAVNANTQRLAADDARNDARYEEILAQAALTQKTDPSLSAHLSLIAAATRPADDTAMTMLLASQNLPIANTFGGHSGAIYHTAISPLGLIASASYDQSIRLWSADRSDQAPEENSLLEGHTSWVTSVAFSPDGQVLASGSGDHTVLLWDVSDPARPHRVGAPLEGHSGAVYMVAFSPDGRTLASASDDGTVRLWNVEKPSDVTDRTPPLQGHDGAVRSVAFSPDGTTLASGSDDRTARLWNISDAAEPLPWGPPLVAHSDTVHSVSFSPDGLVLATASDDATVNLWFVRDPSHPVAAQVPLAGHDAAIWSIGFSPDGASLVSASWDGTARVWSVIDPDKPALLGEALTGNGGGLTTATFTQDGRAVITGGQDGVMRIWTLSDSALAGHSLRVAPPAIGGNGRLMASGSRDGTALVWDIGSGTKPVIRSRIESHDGQGIENLALSPDGTTLAVASLGTGRIQLWDILAEHGPRPAGPPLNVSARYTHELAFSPDGHLLATAADDHSVQLWQMHADSPPTPVTLPLTGAEGWINAVAFSPDSTLLAAASSDKTIRLWDVTTPLTPVPFAAPLVGHAGAVNSLAFSADGHILATGSDDQTIRVWSLRPTSSPELAVLVGHTSTVRSVSFAPTGRMLASGSDDRSVRLWDIEQPAEAWAVGGSLVSDGTARWGVTYGSNPDTLFASGEGGTLRALNLRVNDVRGRVCSVGHNNSPSQLWTQYVKDAPFIDACAS